MNSPASEERKAARYGSSICTAIVTSSPTIDGPTGGKDTVGGVRVMPDIGFGSGIDIAVDGGGAPHQHHLGDMVDEARLRIQGERQIGQRANRHEGDPPGGPSRLDHKVCR